MNLRHYNLYFSLHTVSGLLGSVLLYVVFFAGSFALFKNELGAWQANYSYLAPRPAARPDFNRLLDSLDRRLPLRGRDLELFLRRTGGTEVRVTVLASHDSLVQRQARARAAGAAPAAAPAMGMGHGHGPPAGGLTFTYNLTHRRAVDYARRYDIGEFLYRLHFLAPLNAVPLPAGLAAGLGVPFGYLLAGLTALGFLLALLTGVLLHWRQLAASFFTFRPWAGRKTVWTDLHTSLGAAQLPFQLVFALSGGMLVASAPLLGPFGRLAYRGSEPALAADLHQADAAQFAYAGVPLAAPADLNQLVARVGRRWPGAPLTRLLVRNYQDANMHVIVLAAPYSARRFAGTGRLVYRVRDGRVLTDAPPAPPATYVDAAQNLLYRLHFGDYGGRALRLLYFGLGIAGCVVIIAGVLVWWAARDTPATPARARRTAFWTANASLSVCLSLLPVTAFTLLALLFIPAPGQAALYGWYFGPWLALSGYFAARRQPALITRQSFQLAALLCGLLPLLDGAVRGNWPWRLYAAGQLDLLAVDLLFAGLALACGLVLRQLRRPPGPPAAGVA